MTEEPNQEQNQEPVQVTAEERRHPAYGLLARAAIALAREELAAKAWQQQAEAEPENQEASDD